MSHSIPLNLTQWFIIIPSPSNHRQIPIKVSSNPKKLVVNPYEIPIDIPTIYIYILKVSADSVPTFSRELSGFCDFNPRACHQLTVLFGGLRTCALQPLSRAATPLLCRGGARASIWREPFVPVYVLVLVLHLHPYFLGH